jgi:hypothetical protein
MTTLRAIHDCIDDLKGTTARYARLDAERWEEFRRAFPLRPGPPEATRK